MAAPRRRLSLTPESREALFDLLDPTRPHKQGPNRDADAEDRFQDIERKLVYFFAGRGCSDADDLAMETMLRVAGRCAGLSGTAFTDCIAYFYGVARNVDHERLREAQREMTNRAAVANDPTLLHPAAPPGVTDDDNDHRCLDQCMATLPGEARRLILSYYGGETAAGRRCGSPRGERRHPLRRRRPGVRGEHHRAHQPRLHQAGDQFA